VEEHFMHPALSDHFTGRRPPPALAEKLFDTGLARIADMDAAGIDHQVLSHQSPGSQQMDGDAAVLACQNANDVLADIIAAHSTRFSGFAMLPTEEPAAAAEELDRAINELKLNGAMIHGRSAGRFLDDQFYWPIFERAEKLGVPIYIHPSEPDPALTKLLLSPYDDTHPALTGPAWGFGVETGTHAIRLILSGLFERCPDLQIILGHMGEGLPFWLDRIADSLSRPGNRPCDFAAYLRNNFHVTTSGFFSDTALKCCLEIMGPDRVLFAVDYPYASNARAIEWLRHAPVSAKVREAIFETNATKLLQL